MVFPKVQFIINGISFEGIELKSDHSYFFPFICSTDISENPYVGFCSQVTANHVELTCLLF